MPLPPLLKNSVGTYFANNAIQHFSEMEIFTTVAHVKHKASMNSIP